MKDFHTWVSEQAGKIEDASTIDNSLVRITNTNSFELHIENAYKEAKERWDFFHHKNPTNEKEAEIFNTIFFQKLLKYNECSEYDKYAQTKMYNYLFRKFEKEN